MATVHETHNFRHATAAAGVEKSTVAALVQFLSSNPAAGTKIMGLEYCRKVRLADASQSVISNRHAITFYVNEHFPVFLIALVSARANANLRKSDISGLLQYVTKIRGCLQAAVD